jgi:hypothetical protein
MRVKLPFLNEMDKLRTAVAGLQADRERLGWAITELQKSHNRRTLGFNGKEYYWVSYEGYSGPGGKPIYYDTPEAAIDDAMEAT